MDTLNNLIAIYGYILDCLRALRDICDSGSCNDCGVKKCIYKPKAGQIARYNCPFYKAKGSLD